jgi:hypothetical protein
MLNKVHNQERGVKMTIPASLVSLKNISFPWTESSDRSWLGISFLSWLDAEHAINVMAQAAPAIGYDKTSIRVEWADGERYEARLDITHATAEAPSPIASHIRRALEFTSGRWRPANMTEEQQQSFLAENERLRPGGAAWATKILDGYDIGGSP